MELAGIIKEARQNLETKRAATRFNLDYRKQDFIDLLTIEANRIIIDRGRDVNFTPTSDQAAIIEQLYLFITGNKKFNGNLSKGIALLGPVGTGKTLLLKSFVWFLNRFTDYQISWTHASEINTKSEVPGVPATTLTKHLAIDDVGKESLEMIDFGNHKRPFPELIAARYERPLKLFFTSNLTKKEIEETYGASTADRIREKVNYFILSSKSQRK